MAIAPASIWLRGVSGSRRQRPPGAGGGSVIAQTPGIYSVPVGSYVHTGPATAAKMQDMGGGFTFVNNGTIIGIPDLERQITRTISEGLQRASSIHRSSFA